MTNRTRMLPNGRVQITKRAYMKAAKRAGWWNVKARRGVVVMWGHDEHMPVVMVQVAGPLVNIPYTVDELVPTQEPGPGNLTLV